MSRKQEQIPTSEKFNFEDKVAFVSGAAGGIGRATALAFAREGANVVVADIDEQGNQETAEQIEEHGGRALAVTCDLRESEDVQMALDAAVEEFGRLDFACNNAGVEQGPKKQQNWTRRSGIASWIPICVVSFCL